MFFQVLLHLLPPNLVEELYCQNRNTTELEILHEDRYSLQVGSMKKNSVNNKNSLWQYIILAIHVSIYLKKYGSFVNESLYTYIYIYIYHRLAKNNSM